MLRRKALVLALSTLLALPTQAVQANPLRIWDQLEGTAPKGLVLLLRHAYAPGVGDPEHFRLNDCSTQRNLSDLGRQDAKDVGEWLKRRKLEITRVESSRWCRAKETAELLNLGRVKLNKNLDSLFEETEITNHPQTFEIRRQIVAHRKKSGLLIMVGHYVNIAALTGIGVASGEGVLVRAKRNGELRVLGATPTLGR